MKNELKDEDRIIGSLEQIRVRLVQTIYEIDEQIKYLERVKCLHSAKK